MVPLFFLERSFYLNLIVYLIICGILIVLLVNVSVVCVSVVCVPVSVSVCVCVELAPAIYNSATYYIHHWPFLMASSSISVKSWKLQRLDKELLRINKNSQDWGQLLQPGDYFNLTKFGLLDMNRNTFTFALSYPGEMNKLKKWTKFSS